MMNYYVVTALSIPLLVVSLSGCASDVNGGPTADDPIGEAQLSVGESGCETTTADDSKSQPSMNGQTISSTSPDGSYNHSGDNCGHQYVVEFSPSAGATYFLSHVAWADTLPSTSTECGEAYLTIGAYRKFTGGSWSLWGTATIHGSWNGSACIFSGSTPAPDEADLIRLAGTALYTTGFITIYKKVTVDLQHPN